MVDVEQAKRLIAILELVAAELYRIEPQEPDRETKLRSALNHVGEAKTSLAAFVRMKS